MDNNYDIGTGWSNPTVESNMDFFRFSASGDCGGVDEEKVIILCCVEF